MDTGEAWRVRSTMLLPTSPARETAASSARTPTSNPKHPLSAPSSGSRANKTPSRRCVPSFITEYAAEPVANTASTSADRERLMKSYGMRDSFKLSQVQLGDWKRLSFEKTAKHDIELWGAGRGMSLLLGRVRRSLLGGGGRAQKRLHGQTRRRECALSRGGVSVATDWWNIARDCWFISSANRVFESGGTSQRAPRSESV